MLLIIIVMQLTTGVMLLVLWNKKQSVASFLTYISLSFMMFGLMMYYVKIGGFTINQRNVLFGLPFFTEKVVYLAVPLNNIALLVSGGRIAFAGIFFITAIWHNMYSDKLFQKHKYLYFVAVLPLIVSFVLTLPRTFFSVFAYSYSAQTHITRFVTGMIYLYVIVGLILLLWELVEIKYAFYKKRHTSFTISMFLLALQYAFFSTFDPVSIYQDYQRIRVPTSMLLLNTKNYMWLWYLVLGACIVSCVIVMYQSFKYYKYEYDRSKTEVRINDKMSSANIASSVLMHGLKNQLLTAEILGEKMQKVLKSRNIPDESELIEINEKLLDTNRYMLERLNTMYQTFLQVKTTLKPMTSGELLDAVKEKVGKKYPDFPVRYKAEKILLIADKELLSEAIYNMIINAIEATKGKDDPQVEFSLYNMRQKTHIILTDNGNGIPKEYKKDIFLPFATSKNTNTNWGLGLCYSNQIIKRHMGDLRFESDENGTRFYILLPKYDEKREKE